MAPVMRAMTWNIESHANPHFNPGSVANVMNNQDPDIMGLQEVSRLTMENLVSRLYGAGWPSRGRGHGQIYRYHAATIASIKSPVTGVSAFGNAIVSRLPLSNLTTRVLPFWNEKRLIMGVDVGGFSFPVRAYCTHFSPGSLEHGVDQVDPAAKFTDPDNAHKLRFGDFNYTPRNPTVRSAFYGRFTEVDDPTNRPTHGDAKIDYVFVSKRGFQIVRVDVPNSRSASDHRPLWADLELA
jgi:endonuclease/exonuclease/phosphatase family metal-dependent hydrolase